MPLFSKCLGGFLLKLSYSPIHRRKRRRGSRLMHQTIIPLPLILLSKCLSKGCVWAAQAQREIRVNTLTPVMYALFPELGGNSSKALLRRLSALSLSLNKVCEIKEILLTETVLFFFFNAKLKKKFYSYSITVVYLFSPSIHLHPPP